MELVKEEIMGKGIRISHDMHNTCSYCSKKWKYEDQSVYEIMIENEKRDLHFLWLCKDCMKVLAKLMNRIVEE